MMAINQLLLLLLLLFFTTLATMGHAYISKSDAQRLYTDLTSGYDPRLRPTTDQNASVVVSLVAQLISVLELSTSEQRLTMLMSYTIAWGDESFMWNTSDYGGIDRLVLNINDVWFPRLLVAFSYTLDASRIYDSNSQVSVFSNGYVVWTPTTSVSVHCVVDIALYPFDSQNCTLYIHVPYTSFHEITLNRIDYKGEEPWEHPEWRLIEVSSMVTNTPIDTSITYTYMFKRRAEFIVLTTIVPLILLSVLNACVVLVPVSSGEKGSIAVTLFLSYCVYLTSIGQTLPPNSIKSSYLLIYTTIVQVFSAITMLYSIVQTRMYTNGDKWGFRFACFLRSPQIHACTGEAGVSKGDEDGIDQQKGVQMNGVHETAVQIGDGMDERHQPGFVEDSHRGYRNVDSAVFLLSILLNCTVIVVLSALIAQS